MPTFTFECQSEAELTSLRQAAHFLAELHHLAQTAPDGRVLHVAEGHAVEAGRQFLRDALQSAAQHRLDRAEGKGGRHAAARARPRCVSRGGMAVT